MKWTQLHAISKLPHTNVTNTPLANLANALHNLNILACCSTDKGSIITRSQITKYTYTFTFIQTRTSKLLSLFSCKKWRKCLHTSSSYSILPHTKFQSRLSLFIYQRHEQVLMQLCNSLCWRCFSTVNLLKNWRSGIAWKKAESFAVHQLSSLPSLKSQSQTSYWEISDWKKRLWSEVKAFSFDLCWNAKYVSVWTFVLTRWRSKQRWACWKRTWKTHTQSFLEKTSFLHISLHALP